MTEQGYEVIVIGAGFSGVAAAMALQEHHRVLVLEAGELGGRVRTRVLEDGRVAELGAQYIGRDHRRVMALIDELDMGEQLFDFVPGFGPDPVAVCELEGRRVVTRRSQTYFQIQGLDARAPWREQAKFLLALSTIAGLCTLIDAREPASSPPARWLDAITYADYVESFELPPWFADLMYSGVRCVWSQHPEQMSALYVLWYIKTNGGFSAIFNDQDGSPQQYGLRCGLGRLLERWVEQLHEAPRLHTPVASIEIEPDHALVVTGSGERFVCERVVVAMTPRAAGQITYTPSLSAARQELHAQPAGFAIKALLFYDEPWWRTRTGPEDHVFAWLNGRGTKGIDWVLDASCPAPCLVCFIAPDLLDSLERYDSASVEATICDALVELTGDRRARTPVHIEWTDWRKVEGVGGGPNTNFGPGVLSRVREHWRRPEHGRLYFAGAEYADSYTGYVEGAIASGRSVARQLLSDAPRARLPAERLFERLKRSRLLGYK